MTEGRENYEDCSDSQTNHSWINEDSKLSSQVPSTSLEKPENMRAVQELYRDPSFAVICSFFNRFGVLLGMKPVYFNRFEEMLTNFHSTGKVDRELIDLHLTLLRKLNFKSVRADGWEKYLMKFCSITSYLQSELLQLERFGYIDVPIATKLTVLRSLCERQFDYNLKFKESVLNSTAANYLRLIPIGVDKDGLAYWYQQDADLNLKVYCEEQDDESGGSWILVASSKVELEVLIEKLKSGYSKKDKQQLMPNFQEECDRLKEQIFSNKFGTFLDTFQSTLPASLEKTTRTVNETPIRQATRKKVKIEKKYDQDDDDAVDNPESFMDRRVLPRRSARFVAIMHLKELGGVKHKSGCGKNVSMKSKPSIKDESHIAEESSRDHGLEIVEEGAVNSGSEENDSSQSLHSDDDEYRVASDEIKPFKQNHDRSSIDNMRKKTTHSCSSDDENVNDYNSELERDKGKERRVATGETCCLKCYESKNPEVLLLCDMCDDAWHTWCLRPMLWFVPDGDWFCPNCQHLLLLEKFSAVSLSLNDQLKSKASNDKRKQAAADRLKREVEYLGVSITNIIPSKIECDEGDTDESMDDVESDSEHGDGVEESIRKSKRKALRKMKATVSRPIVPIALGRSRRQVSKIDYNFAAYDDLIQEAMGDADESAAKRSVGDVSRPQGGAGRGKDISNIINAEINRLGGEGMGSVGDEDAERLRKSKKFGKPKNHRRLNDLDVDEVTDSESDEYCASSSGSNLSDPSDFSDAYLPSDEASNQKRRSGRRTQSDIDFVVSESESDYEMGRKRSKRLKKSSKDTSVKNRKRGRVLISSEDSTSEEEENDYESEESSDHSSKKRRSSAAHHKWAPRASSSEEEESRSCDEETEQSDYRSDSRKSEEEATSMNVEGCCDAPQDTDKRNEDRNSKASAAVSESESKPNKEELVKQKMCVEENSKGWLSFDVKSISESSSVEKNCVPESHADASISKEERRDEKSKMQKSLPKPVLEGHGNLGNKGSMFCVTGHGFIPPVRPETYQLLAAPISSSVMSNSPLMDPSAFIQQVARLASPARPYSAPQSHPVYIHAQGEFPCGPAPLSNPYPCAYPPNVPPNIYPFPTQRFAPMPHAVNLPYPPGVEPWAHYPTQNTYPSFAAPPPTLAAPSHSNNTPQPITEADSIGSALASAMDF